MEKTIGKGRAARLAVIVTGAFAAAIVAAACLLATPANAASGIQMQRLYNPNSGEHFYTASAAERDHLVSVGWKHEGVGWTAPSTSETPVHRLYNANAGDHHYTASAAERDHLVSVGWRYEGVGWYSDDARGVPLYRQYNPNALAGSHNYTADVAENDMLVSVGWRAEGIGWYGIDPNASDGPQQGATTQPGDAQKPSGSGDANQGSQTQNPVQVPRKHAVEAVYKAEPYVISEAYDYQNKIDVGSQWQCSCLETFDSPEKLSEHQSYYIRVLNEEGHGRSRVVPVYEYETVHVPAVMGEREVFDCYRCKNCGAKAYDDDGYYKLCRATDCKGA